MRWQRVMSQTESQVCMYAYYYTSKLMHRDSHTSSLSDVPSLLRARVFSYTHFISVVSLCVCVYSARAVPMS